MYVANVCSKCLKHMSHVFRLDVVMIIQVCFNSKLHMLQRSDGCCKGDETLGLGKGNGRGRARWRTGARRGKERGGLDAQGGGNQDKDRVVDGRTRYRSWVAGLDSVAQDMMLARRMSDAKQL